MWRDAAFVALFFTSYFVAPMVVRWVKLPIITVYLAFGLLAQVLLNVRMPKLAGPAHEAALACITFAAGSELIVSQLRQNYRAICWVSVMLTLGSLVFVGGSTFQIIRSFGGSAAAMPGLSDRKSVV